MRSTRWRSSTPRSDRAPRHACAVRRNRVDQIREHGSIRLSRLRRAVTAPVRKPVWRYPKVTCVRSRPAALSIDTRRGLSIPSNDATAGSRSRGFRRTVNGATGSSGRAAPKGGGTIVTACRWHQFERRLRLPNLPGTRRFAVAEDARRNDLCLHNDPRSGECRLREIRHAGRHTHLRRVQRNRFIRPGAHSEPANGWRAFITSPDEVITSMNGVVTHAERGLDFTAEADAVIIGSGVKTFEIADNPELLAQIRLDPKRQLVGSQCSGTLLLAKLGLLEGRPACTDLSTKKWVVETGVSVIDGIRYRPAVLC